MHTQITPENPYGCNRYGFAWENVPCGGAAHLDFGCNDGAFLASLTNKGIARLVGVDINGQAVRDGQMRFPDVQLIHISGTVPLPFRDGEFSSVSVLDVIEHVDDQIALLHEINRLLQDDGTLIVTVPRQHLFSLMDVGNLKFRFPGLHRWYYCRKHTMAEYESRYLSNPDGLVGDISAKKRWHEHFSRTKLASLLKSCGFTVVEFDGTGLFNRPIRNLSLVLGRLRRIRLAIKKLEALDARLFESANLFCLAKKPLS